MLKIGLWLDVAPCPTFVPAQAIIQSIAATGDEVGVAMIKNRIAVFEFEY